MFLSEELKQGKNKRLTEKRETLTSFVISAWLKNDLSLFILFIQKLTDIS